MHQGSGAQSVQPSDTRSATIHARQMPVVAGTCSSRIVFNVPGAHSSGVELELTAAPTDRFDFGISASVGWTF